MEQTESRKSNEARFKELYATLNEEQKKAVDALIGPVLVIAGPGTGKTQILSARIANLLYQRDLQVFPENILCLTYTDAGAIAMRKRLLSFIGTDAHRVSIGTFHSFCNNVIQNNPSYFSTSDLEPITELESILYLEDLLRHLPADDPNYSRSDQSLSAKVRDLRNFFNSLKTEAISLKELRTQIDAYIKEMPYLDEFQYKRAYKNFKKGDVKQQKIDEEVVKLNKILSALQLYEAYEAKLNEKGRYDFNDMLLWVDRVFTEHPELKLRYQEQFQYLLVDEYQDTSGAQNKILYHLIDDPDNKPNVFVVGDDDQSIFKFQGASVDNIIDFHLRYKEESERVVLDKNYRSTPSILNAASTFIAENNNRLIHHLEGIDKNLLPSNTEKKSSGEKIQIQEFKNPLEEKSFIINKVKDLIEEGTKPEDIAVLYTKHKIAEDISYSMEKSGVPISIRRGHDLLKDPFISKFIDIFNFIAQTQDLKYGNPTDLIFKVLHFDWFETGPLDISLLSRALYNQKKKEFKDWHLAVKKSSFLEQSGIRNPDAIRFVFEKLETLIGYSYNATPQVLLQKTVEELNVMEYIMKSDQRDFLLQALNKFFDFIKGESVKREFIDLSHLLQLLEQMRNHELTINLFYHHGSEEGVQFITTHSSKGLEFEHVFLIDTTKKNWDGKKPRNSQFKLPGFYSRQAPDKKDKVVASDNNSDAEEIRRLFFVAITRAAGHLYISYSLNDEDGKALEQSGFVSELLKTSETIHHKPSLSAGDLNTYLLNRFREKRHHPIIELVDDRAIERALKGFKMSVTALSKYMRCPVSFYFENVIKVPQARNERLGFGNAVHHALELFYKEMAANPSAPPDEAKLINYFESGMKIYHSHFTKEQYKQKREYGAEVLRGYLKNKGADFSRVIVTEYSIQNVEHEGVPLTGKLDKIEFGGYNAHVIDYKTGKYNYGKLKEPDEKEPDGGDYWRQMTFYQILMDEDRKQAWKMVKGSFEFIEPDDKNAFKTKTYTITADHKKFLSRKIKESYEKILNHEFSRGCGDEKCSWCNFVKTNFKELKLEAEEEDAHQPGLL